jgi:hypothetical protein
MYIWGRANDDCGTDLQAFWKKEETAGTLVTSTELCHEPWSLWIQEEENCRMLKQTYTTLSMTQKQQRPGDCETYRIPRISMYQLDVTPQKAPIYHNKSGS